MSHRFYLTEAAPCPYLPDKMEQKIFLPLKGEKAAGLHDVLVEAGFRRNQTIAYKPACAGCCACTSARVLVDFFRVSRSFQRVINKNKDLVRRVVPPVATVEHYNLFRRYLGARHAEEGSNGGMLDMNERDFADMVEDSAVNTLLVEYRENDALVAAVLTDRLSDGFSMVYSFYEPDKLPRSLGTFLILDHVSLARQSGLPHLYLGFYIEGSPKMGYKIRFEPQEHLYELGWQLCKNS